MASEETQHKGLLSTATAHDPEHYENRSRFKTVHQDTKCRSGKVDPSFVLPGYHEAVNEAMTSWQQILKLPHYRSIESQQLQTLEFCCICFI